MGEIYNYEAFCKSFYGDSHINGGGIIFINGKRLCDSDRFQQRAVNGCHWQ